MHGGDLLPLVVPGEGERKLRHSLAGLLCDELDGLNHAVHYLVFYAGVLSLRVLPDGHHVHVVVQGLDAGETDDELYYDSFTYTRSVSTYFIHV